MEAHARMHEFGRSAKRRNARGPWSPAQLDRFIERATVDAYDEQEQRLAFFTMLESDLSLPFASEVLGHAVTVEAIDLTDAGEIIAVCRRDRFRQRIPILELPLPSPLPTGAKWIEAYRRWTRR